MVNILSTATFAVLTLSPLTVAAQRLIASQQGCPLDLSTKIASEVKCGKSITVAFAVEWYGADVAQLEKWLRLAGCGDNEAVTEAAWVADRCGRLYSPLAAQINDNAQPWLPEGPIARRLSGKRTVDVDSRTRAKRATGDDDDDDSDDDDSTDDSSTDDDTTSTQDDTAGADADATSSTSTSSTSTKSTTTSSTTLSTSTTSTDTSSTSSTSITSSSTSTNSVSSSSISTNPYVYTKVLSNEHTTSTSLLTCMTVTSTTSSVCSVSMTRINHGVKYTSSCTPTVVPFPSCVPGVSCSFSQTTGAISCYELGAVPVYGRIILAIMGIGVFMALSAVLTLCCRERHQVKRFRQAAEEKALLLTSYKSNSAAAAAAAVNVTRMQDVKTPSPPQGEEEEGGGGVRAGVGSQQQQQQKQSTTHDTVPLMHAEEEEAEEEAAETATPPHIVVSSVETPTQGTAGFPTGRYDPFTDDEHRTR